MARMEMGTCEHEQVEFTKTMPTGKTESIWCCIEPHARLFAMALQAKGFRSVK